MKLPNTFWQRLGKIYSSKDLEIVKSGLQTVKRKPSFRINLIKTSNSEEVEKILENNGLKISEINFLENAYVVENGREKDLWDLDIFKNGNIYLQSISSQIPAIFLDLQNGDKVLDVTAAPGSKTSQIASILGNSGEIVANDNNQIRIDKLKFTLKRQGVSCTKIIKSDARKLQEKFKKNYFDKILADLPCSAEGRINLNNEKSYGFWKESIFAKNSQLQKEILSSVISLLKLNGVLVYSTCTLAPEENEGIVSYLLANFPELEIEKISLDYENIRPGITDFGKTKFDKNVVKSIRCLPSKETEGFFVAKFRKKF